MDGKGRCMDNIFVERLWRSLKYEEVYLNAYGSVAEAKAGIATANKGFDIDEVKSRIVQPAIAVAATGAEIEIGRATP